MQPAISYRKGIPFFHQKTPVEFQQDIYERYDKMVVRHSALHLADEMWGRYPFQPVFNFAEKYYPEEAEINIAEIGCGVGRWIGMLAKLYPKATLWGIDYSYQMLKRAKEFWIEGKEISIDWTDKGLPLQVIKGKQIKNLNFGLAKAEKLPFDDRSQNLVLNSFLIDRLENPFQGLKEMYRVLKPGGKLIAVTPLNFNTSKHWEMLYPSFKLKSALEEIGFDILDWEEEIKVEEPLDAHGNVLTWKCLGFVAKK